MLRCYIEKMKLLQGSRSKSLLFTLRSSLLWPALIFVFILSFSVVTQASDNCFDLIQRFVDTPDARVSLPTESLVQKHAEIADLLDKMSPPKIDFPAYIKQFQVQNQRTPTLREAIEFVYSERRDLHNAYDEMLGFLSDSAQEAELRFKTEVETSRAKLSKFRDFDSLEDEVAENFASGKSSVQSIDTPIPVREEGGVSLFDEDYYRFLKDKTGLSNYTGEIGELLAYAQSPDYILKRGLRFDGTLEQATGYEKEIAERVELLRSNLNQRSLLELKEIIANYTTERGGFLRHAAEFVQSKDGEEVANQEVVEKIMAMVTSKEIDLVSITNQRKVVWAEVKAYGQTITVEVLEGRGAKKSILDQLLEHKALRDLLGLESSVELRFLTPLAGIEEQARYMIEEIGYQVL